MINRRVMASCHRKGRVLYHFAFSARAQRLFQDLLSVIQFNWWTLCKMCQAKLPTWASLCTVLTSGDSDCWRFHIAPSRVIHFKMWGLFLLPCVRLDHIAAVIFCTFPYPLPWLSSVFRGAVVESSGSWFYSATDQHFPCWAVSWKNK